MKKNWFTIWLIIIVKLALASGSITNNSDIVIQTDRFCYVSGDYILVNACHLNALHQTNPDEAVLYVDIADKAGNYISGELLYLDGGIVSGYIQIPDSVRTGYYWLRAYTYNAVKNTGQNNLQQLELYITNRFGNNGERYAGDKVIYPHKDSLILKEVSNENLKLNFDKQSYGKRSKVSLKCDYQGLDLSDTVWAAISVKPVSSLELQMQDQNDIINSKPDLTVIQNKTGKDINENKGIIVTGTVRHDVTQRPLANYIVMLAFEDSVLRFRYSITDEDGKFSILLHDFYGEQTAYISVYTNPGMELYTQAEISVDSKFINKPNLSEKKTVGYEISYDSLNVLKATISKAYNITEVKEIPKSNHNDISFEQMFFTGKINQTVMMDDYVDLPDFIQISREILPYIRLRKKEAGYIFSVNDGINNLVRHNSFVFVDGVPLTKIDNLINWGTDKIKSVQVQIEPRYYGDISFENGIILIWTRKLDFWENSENDYTHRFILKGFQKPINFSFPDYSNQKSDYQPDFRQTLYWEPGITISSGKVKEINFYTSDESGQFEVVLKGVNNKKKLFSIRKYFQVK